MRLRLVHTLSLTLLAFTGVAVLALGGLTAWQLRNGFGEYLAARDAQHFERFILVLEKRIARSGGTDELLAGRMDLRSLVEELDPWPGFPRDRPDPQRLPPSRGPDFPAFPDRIQVLSPEGELLLGQPNLPPVGDKVLVERAVHANGRVVALARMLPGPMVRTGSDARFLRDQYALIAAATLGLTVLALVTGTWLARRWARPLEAVQDATRRLAHGEFAIRLAESPALARGDEIGDVARNVNRMAEGLQQLESSRRRWLADISHELRTPLTVLRGDIEALHDGVRPLQPDAVAALREDVLRLTRLVDDLHLLAIADLQTLPCHLANDDAITMMQRLHGRYENRASDAGLRLHLTVQDHLPSLGVQWDTGRIEQLLTNLLENSLRYTEAPGEIAINLEYTDTTLTITIEDSEPGLPPGQLSHLFEPLYRGDKARESISDGSGLGLAICRVIAKAHGGELSAAASPLGGLRLTLLLPQPEKSPPAHNSERAP
jgi:two-component system sensor histidine kinase BaeS